MAVATEQPGSPPAVGPLDYFFLSLGELLYGDQRDSELIAKRINRLHQIRAELGGLLDEEVTP